MDKYDERNVGTHLCFLMFSDVSRGVEHLHLRRGEPFLRGGASLSRPGEAEGPGGQVAQQGGHGVRGPLQGRHSDNAQ